MTRKELITSDEYLKEYMEVAIRERWKKKQVEDWLKKWRDEIILEFSAPKIDKETKK